MWKSLRGMTTFARYRERNMQICYKTKKQKTIEGKSENYGTFLHLKKKRGGDQEAGAEVEKDGKRTERGGSENGEKGNGSSCTLNFAGVPRISFLEKIVLSASVRLEKKKKKLLQATSSTQLLLTNTFTQSYCILKSSSHPFLPAQTTPIPRLPKWASQNSKYELEK